MATILKYHEGKMIPVNRDEKNLMSSENHSENESFGNSVYFQSKKMTTKKRFYGNLLLILVASNIALMMMVVIRFHG